MSAKNIVSSFVLAGAVTTALATMAAAAPQEGVGKSSQLSCASTRCAMTA
jgi:hypothetical protein